MAVVRDAALANALWSKVKSVTEAAKLSGALQSFQTQIEVVPDCGIQVSCLKTRDPISIDESMLSALSSGLCA